MAQESIPLLRGMPVLIMRRGVYPNKSEIMDIQADWPGYIVRTESVFTPCRFAVTVQRKK